ncbi:MAG: Tol-Pal system beta propeller repeat protein TolB [Alphaproteobacteria bacterium]
MKKIYLLITALILCSVFTNPAMAELRIQINRGQNKPLPIALPDFHGNSSSARSLARKMQKVVAADLERSGLFKIIDEDNYIQKTNIKKFIPQFADWRVIDAEGLIRGKVILDKAGTAKVTFKLWDVFAEKRIAGFSYSTPKDNWRRIAHMMSDTIYKRLTGEAGYFDTRIVYVAETGPVTKRKKRLAIMDQDGANHHYLTDGSYLVLTPRFAPSMQKITYLAYYKKVPHVYLLDLETGRQSTIGKFPSMTFAPRFSPDERYLVMSMAERGNSDIYRINLKTKKSKRLTRNGAIDTSPCFSPNGKRIVFNSDRGGSQQLYMMTRNGRNVHRISFGDGGRYGTPVWSPRGDLIAFTKMKNRKFYIGVMRPDGSGERLLTESYLDEAPTWSPNGRVLIFFRQAAPRDAGNKNPKLYSIDLTGHNLREVVTPTAASDPAWSPLLP